MDETPQPPSDDQFMSLALGEARRAAAAGEVPVGAVIADRNGTILGRGCNCPIASQDPCGHAEIIVIRQAAAALGNYRLNGLTLYSTLEPCLMCAGAMIHARIERLVYAASDPRAGAAGSVYNVLDDQRLNHQVEVVRGLREVESRELLQLFFAAKR